MSETTTLHPDIPTTPAPADTGLRSARGIRWLLLAGSLVTGVSVYRLLEARWAAIPVPLQFLILVAGALGIFGLGLITRRRLHLPYAGSALLFLFTGLLPVLAWGAAWLRLLDTVGGWLAFSAGGAVLLGAAVSVLRSELRYPGRLYPAALGVLFVAQATLPFLGQRWPFEGLYAMAAVALGVVLHAGSRHVNRFFFHRDQRDGRDRPLHLVPFLLLGVLYIGALTGLDLDSTFLALPLAVLGIVLAGTGEEYYRALSESLGHTPKSWPWRSVALLALGFSLTVAALPLALRDPSGRCLFLVALCAAGLFLRWCLRYGQPAVHVLGVLAALVAYNSLPALAPELARELTEAAASFLGLYTGSPVLLGWGQLGFLAILTGLGVLLRRGQLSEKLLRTHGALTALMILWITSLGLDGLHATSLLGVTLGLALLDLFWTRRIETAAVIPFVLAATLFKGFPPLKFLEAFGAAAAGMLLLALSSPVLDRLLARWTGASVETARRALLLPPMVISLIAAVPAAVVVLIDYGLSSLACMDILLAGAVWMVAGYRFRWPSRFAMGALVASLGAHGALLFQLTEAGLNPQTWLAALTQTLFVLFWLASRASRPGGRLDASMHVSLRTLAILHGFLGLVWIVDAGTGATIEPLILLLGGLALLWDSLVDRKQEGTRHEGIDAGLALVVLWLPIQILIGVSGPWSRLLIAGLTLVGLELGLLVFAARRSAGHALARRLGMDVEDWDVLTALSLRGLVRVWLVLAAAAGLLFAGWEVLVLTLTMTGVLFLTRSGIEGWASRLAFPARLTLLPLLQFAVLAAAMTAGIRPDRDLIPALSSLDVILLPWLVACALAWRGLIEILGRRRSLRSWTLGVETVMAVGYVLATSGPGLGTWGNAALIALAAGWAAVSFLDAKRDRDAFYGWQMQAWAGLAVLHAFTAGWLYFGSGVAPYVLLAVGAAQYALGAWYERKDLGTSITPSCRFVGLALPLLAGSLSLTTTFSGVGIGTVTVWFPVLATFLVSLFYTVVASRETRRIFPATASVVFLGLALLKAVATAELGTELYCLAPGFGLLLLAWLLRAELGPLWNHRVTAAGASFVYATPIVALSSEISWGWLAALLVLSVAFGAASFALRSRSLLTVSTAALLTDLGFFVFRIGTTAPLVLWVLGLGFGLTLMGTAAWLEYRREGVLQQLRVFGQELQSWS